MDATFGWGSGGNGKSILAVVGSPFMLGSGSLYAGLWSPFMLGSGGLSGHEFGDGWVAILVVILLWLGRHFGWAVVVFVVANLAVVGSRFWWQF